MEYHWNQNLSVVPVFPRSFAPGSVEREAIKRSLETYTLKASAILGGRSADYAGVGDFEKAKQIIAEGRKLQDRLYWENIWPTTRSNRLSAICISTPPPPSVRRAPGPWQVSA